VDRLIHRASTRIMGQGCQAPPKPCICGWPEGAPYLAHDQPETWMINCRAWNYGRTWLAGTK